MLNQQILIPLCLLAFPLLAASQVNIYDNPANLKVLPKDTTSDVLRETMKNFALGTGFRCSSCHVGEEGLPLTDYDFASDEKELKGKARLMLKMLNTINGTHLADLGDERMQVECVTCHRGVHKPESTGALLTVAADEGGVDGMTTRYRELRERYHGSHSYDFTDKKVAVIGSGASAIQFVPAIEPTLMSPSTKELE